MSAIKKTAEILLPLAILGGLLFWFLTSPEYVSDAHLDDVENGDPVAGETVFWAGGCASCHAASEAKGAAKLVLGGGHALKTPFGTFHTPNISPDPVHGIGRWTGKQFANAMLKGVSPQGQHYYPSFPYTSYARMTATDIADLWAFLKTVPLAANSNKNHDLWLPFRLRRGLGLWKLLFLDAEPVLKFDAADAMLLRGRYLVEALAHCGECHTPRNLIGGVDKQRWLAGGPSPEGKGTIPNITPHETGLAAWSLNDITYGLETGFTPEFDSFGSSMVSVQQNMAKLTPEDREAIAVYLKAVTPIASPQKKR